VIIEGWREFGLADAITVGFEKLGEATGRRASSACSRGNPQVRNLFGVIGYLQKQAGVELHVRQGPG
jgi:hypothetical protein